MSFSYNRVILVARGGDAPQVRFASTGQTIATLSVATDRRVKAGATPTIDSHRVICWDRLVKGAVIYRT
jgi:single-stranded DNA-binding protein